MSDDPAPRVIMVPVRRHDVTLTLDALLTPLTRTADQLIAAARTNQALAAARDPEVAQHLRRFTELVTELNDLVRRINEIDPALLTSKPGPDQRPTPDMG